MQQALGPRLMFFSGLAASLTAAELATAYPARPDESALQQQVSGGSTYRWNPAH